MILHEGYGFLRFIEEEKTNIVTSRYDGQIQSEWMELSIHLI